MRSGMVHLGERDRYGFDPERLENDLSQLWKTAAESGAVVSRACLANLILAVPAGRDVTDLVEDITRIHPSRVLIVRPDPDQRPGELEAWVSASCRLRPDEGMVCCESITLETGPGAERALPNAIRSLLVRSQLRAAVLEGVPWRDAVWVAELGSSLDVVFGNGSLLSARDTAELWRRCVSSETGDYRDLLWTKLAVWRRALASAFDGANQASALADIARVTVAIADLPVAVPGAALLTGWLASRLGWRTGSEGDRAQATGPAGSVELCAERVDPGDDTARIRWVRLEFRGSREPLRFRRVSAERAILIERGESSAPGTGETSGDSGFVVIGRINRARTSRASAVVEELHHHHADPLAGSAMDAAAPLLKAWSRP